jgi:hypothetical protein
MKSPLFAGLLAIILTACQNQNRQNVELAPATQVTQKNEITQDLPDIDTRWNTLAQMLAGDTTQYQLHKSVWMEYARNSNQKWDVLSQKIAKPIENWAKTQGYNEKYPTRTLLYPFAGGDFFYANLFFPDKDTIIMVGLEPGGHLFNPDSVTAEELGIYLTNLEKSLFYPHKLGFFRTNSMAIDFNRGLLNGTIHTCLYYLAKAGKQIHYVKAMNFNDSGEFTDVIDIGTSKHGRKGYRIGFASPKDNQVKELIYFSENLANSGVYVTDGKTKSLIRSARYLEKQRNTSSFFKAATYLMHKSYFSWIRYTCTHASNIILQDDSGISLALLEEAGYNVQLFGNYTRTIPLFSNRFQEDLKIRYEKEKPKTLPFTIGYNAQFGECNLQLATK